MPGMLILALAAALEVAGDALIRMGLQGGRAWGLLAGGLVLFAYGLMVNLPKWDFSRLMGAYIALFFVVAQGVSVLVFKEKLSPPLWVGGSLIVVGGLVISFWTAP